MKKTAAAILVFITGSVFLAAGDREPVPVNIDNALNEIQNLQDKIAYMETDTGEKDEVRERLDDEINLLLNQVETINSRLRELSIQAGNIHSLMGLAINSESMRKLLDEFETIRIQQYALENTKQKFLEIISGKEQARYIAERRITRNLVDIRNNNERIIWLEQCVDYTEGRYPEFDAAISESRKVTGEVAEFINSLESLKEL